MYLDPKFGIVLLSLAGVLGTLALMLGSAGEGRPSDSQMREALEVELDRLAPPGAVMCGVVPRHFSRIEALACVRGCIASRTPFVVALQEQGEDSDVWSGLAGNARGELQALVFDSSPHGAPQVTAEYFVRRWPCRDPVFADVGNGAIRCEQ